MDRWNAGVFDAFVPLWLMPLDEQIAMFCPLAGTDLDAAALDAPAETG